MLRARVDPVHGRHVERAREVVDDGVEQGLDALVLERRAAEHGNDRQVERRGAQRAAQHLGRHGALVVEVRLHELVVVVGHGVDQLVVVLGRLLGELGRNLAHLCLGAERVRPHERAHLDEVDDAAEVLLLADRQLHGNGPRAEPVDHRLHRREEVGADAVHLVHEGDARHAVAVGLAPDGLRLGLDTGHGVEHRDRAVEHAQ